MYSLLRLLPKNYISFFIGQLVYIPLPKFLAGWIIAVFARFYRIDLESVEKPVSDYPSLGRFFVRSLKPGLRPITSEGIASPVDGLLRNAGTIQDACIEQVKGKNYSLTDFLGSDESAGIFNEGTFFNFYLSPSDYHHIHSPVSGMITSVTHIPGKLWPVNDWSLRCIKDLFAINERLIVTIESEFGGVSVVMIGAFNVGSIGLEFDSIRTNRNLMFRSPQKSDRVYEKKIPVKIGQRLGTFYMGSSVVLLFQKGGVAVNEQGVLPRVLKYGEVVAS